MAMTFFLLTLMVFFLTLIQSVFGWPNLALFLVVLVSAYQSPRQGIVLAFLAGVLVDLAAFHPLGSSSGLFLVVTGLILVYRRRFSVDHPLFLPLFALLSSLITRQTFWSSEVVVFAILALVLRQLSVWFFGRQRFSGRLKL